MKLLLAVCLAGLASAQSWIPHQSGVTVSLRGVSAVNRRVIWASGAEGTYLASRDGGASWRVGKVPGADALDFRDVHGVDDRTAYLLSSGHGEKSRIYKTTDAGAHWSLQFTSFEGFFDAFGFWDARRGIVLGDPVSGEFEILTTGDGGGHWAKQHAPQALPGEGGFAASGSCILAMGKHECWFATGGAGAARVFHSTDGGATWTVASTPVRNDRTSAGIFSLGFSDPRHGVAVGGDYTQPADGAGNIAITDDGGKKWREPRGPHPAGYRSAVAYIAKHRLWIAVGTSGSDVSADGGESWKSFDSAPYNAVSFAPDGSGWAVGPGGSMAEFRGR